MHVDVFAFWGILVTALIILAEVNVSWRVLGIIAGVTVIIAGLWVISDGVQIQQGQTVMINETINSSIENYSVMNRTEVVSPTWIEADFPVLPAGMSSKQLYGLMLLLLGLVGSWTYWLRL
jgi:hypothetical protein